MQALIISGDYKCGNIGDVAMLQVAVKRLKDLWPASHIRVFTNDPDALAFHCPDVTPLFHNGRRAWFSDRYLLGRLHQFLPQLASRELMRLKRSIRHHSPTLLEFMVRLKMWMRGVDNHDFNDFMNAFHEADFIVISGQAGLNDLIRTHSIAVLDLLEMAIRSGKITAMFSQGVGPLRDSELLARAKKVLPGVNLIALREGRFGHPFLESIGVAQDHILITGDDAVEMTYDAHTPELGCGIGVNLRIAPYAGVNQMCINSLRPVLHEFGRKLGAPLVPIPISRHEDFRDAMVIKDILAGYDELSDGGRGLDTPLKVIEQAGRCRVVVSGAYHGAVFSLAQGIPAVCLAASEYVANKFLGLAEQFGVGCEIVFLNDEDIRHKLTSAINRSWESAGQVRSALLKAAKKQSEDSRAAYQKVKEIIGSRELAG